MEGVSKAMHQLKLKHFFISSFNFVTVRKKQFFFKETQRKEIKQKKKVKNNKY